MKQEEVPLMRGYRQVLSSLIIALVAASAPAPARPAPVAGAAGGPADASGSPLLRPRPRGFLRLAYCGSARRGDPANELQRFDWDEAARAFDLTIVQSTANDYRRFVQSLVRQNPDHRVLYYAHAHGLYAADDRAGTLNLTESNFAHATDPASLRVIPTPEGLLVDWERDERYFYDEVGLISEAREFNVYGYVVYRAQGDGEFAQIWPERPAPGEASTDEAGAGFAVGDSAAADSAAGQTPSVAVTEFLDRAIESGERYRYVVRTIGPVQHEYPFSWAVEAVAGAPAAVPFVHELQTALEAEPGAPPYVARFRIRVETPGTQARLRIDRNADRDFDDPGETVAMNPATGNFVEAIVGLDPRERTQYEAATIFGFAYRLEFESPGGQLVLPARGVYTTNINNRVRASHYGFYVMHMDAPSWFDHLQRAIDLGVPRQGGMLSGVFLDELVVNPMYGVDAVPIDLSLEQFVSGACTLVRALKGERPELALYMNGLQSFAPIEVGDETGAYESDIQLDPWTLAVIDSLTAAGITGGMIEGFALAPWQRTRGGAPWVVGPRDWLIQQAVARAAAQRGLEVLLLTRAPDADPRSRLFAFGSHLLAREPGMRFGYMVDRCRAEPYPEWGVDLGQPLSTAVAADGKARGRAFERGMVWVNIHPLDTVRVGGSEGMARLELDAGASVDRVTWVPVRGEVVIGPQSAVILASGAAGGAGGEEQEGARR